MEPSHQTEETLPATESTPQDKKSLLLMICIGVLAIVAAVVLFNYAFRGDSNTPSSPDVVATTDFGELRRKSTAGEDQKPIQDFFANQVATGVNDSFTRSAIYWITHRYFDNGGNIYEIFDYIEANPEIAFLKEAEGIYPTVFEKVRERTVTNYSRESLLALLAYYQVIDYHGYASIAIWGLAANKYSEQALMNRPNPGDTPEIAEERSRYFADMVRNAQKFVARSEDYIINNTLETGTLSDLYKTDVEVNDLLVGLNQHASALANLEALGYVEPSAFSIIELFEHNSEFSLREVPRLYFFTNYLYATALLQTGRATPEEIAVPLKRVVEYARVNTDWRPGGSIERVISSKNIRESSLFSYEFAKGLAALNGDFKVWLMENGWEDSDF